MLFQQRNRCALCGEKIEDDAVLDHCHKTGRLRKVLHRGCNALLGKIENNMPRNKVSEDRLLKFAMNLHRYITQPYPEIIHPTHKTPEERKECTRKKAQRKRQLKSQERRSTNASQES